MLKNKIYKIYLDTSVIGGVFDVEFNRESNHIFDLAKNNQIKLITSQLVLDELKNAPKLVRDFLNINLYLFDKVDIGEQAIEMMNRYLSAKIVTVKSRNDALHVAIATESRVDAIVSWNFKHIVKLEKMKKYVSCNLESGYGFLQIITPKEV